MKKLIIFTIIFIIALMPVFSLTSSAANYNIRLTTEAENDKKPIKSEAYYLMNVDTESVIFSHNADKPMKCASLVKIATAILVIENCENLDEVVTASETALSPLKYLYSASVDLKVGEQMSVRNLLYCMMLKNANDASNVLAEYVGGTIENFVTMMNERAKELGCKNTNFTNAHGLDEAGEYTTAYDMYLLTRKALEYSVLSDMSRVIDYTVPATNMSQERKLNTTFDMIEEGTRYFYTYARGFKCGMTDEAQRCASFVASKDAHTYIGVILGCPNEDTDKCGYKDNTALFEAKIMLRWAFINLNMTVIAETNQAMVSVPVKLSLDADHVNLVPEKQLQALVLDTVDTKSLEYIYDIPEELQAPVAKGQVVGTVEIRYAEDTIARATLVAGDDVSRNGVMFFWHIMKTVFLSPIFITIAVIVVAGVIGYVAWIYTKHKKKMKEDRRRLREIKERNLGEYADLNEVGKR